MKMKSLLLGALRSNPLSELAMERVLFWSRIQRSPMITTRTRIARRFLEGHGLEIGALHNPMNLGRDVRVRYVDYQDVEAARCAYPELKHHKLTRVDIVDDGETLTSVAPESVDFIVANHMIEHCQNPLSTIENWLSKLHLGGVIFMAVPDLAHTFDRERQPTTTEHLLRDWREPNRFLREDYEDFARYVSKIDEDALTTHVDRLIEERANIHFHAWRLPNFLEMLTAFRGAIGNVDVEFSQNNGDEFIVVLRKN